MSNDSAPVLVPKKRITVDKQRKALSLARKKLKHAVAGKPDIPKTPRAGPQRAKPIPLEIREKIKLERIAGTSRNKLGATYGVRADLIRQWEDRYAWPTPEAIARRAVELKNMAAGIKPASPVEKTNGAKALSIREDKIKIDEKLEEGKKIIEMKALTLVQVGEQNAERVAKSVSELIKTSLEAQSIRPPADMTELSTAFKMVEQATGRNKPQQVNVQLGVSVSPHMSSIIGDIRPGTVTLDADIVQDDVSPTWLSCQLTDDQDAGL